MIAAVETGGTKIFCAVAHRDRPHEIIDSTRIATTTPDESLAAVSAFLRGHHERERIDAVGVASFGPLETDPASAQYGWITTTPKAGWLNTDLHRVLDGLDDPAVEFVTDVTGSLLGERARGSATGLENVAYATVGTGVGVGVLVEGRVVTGHGTPELGHILVRRHPSDDFAGVCRYHGDCLEGLASGPAIQARWGRPAEGKEREVIAYYIAQLAVAITLAIAPGRVVIGGGVAKTEGLLDLVRLSAASLMAGYLGEGHPIQDPNGSYIVWPELGDFAGIHGALELADSLLSLPRPR